METNTLNITLRTELKKRPSAKLRQEGMIPAVVYGSKEPMSIAVNEREFEKKFHRISENVIITLMLDGSEKCDVLIKDYQDDIITGKIRHLDFFEVEKNKTLKANIPVRLEGAPVGVKAGGVLEQFVHTIEVECLPRDIPGEIVINVDDLDINQAIYVKDIPELKGVKFLIPDDSIVAHVVHVKELVVEVPAEETEEAAAEESSETAGTSPASGDEEKKKEEK